MSVGNEPIYARQNLGMADQNSHMLHSIMPRTHVLF